MPISPCAAAKGVSADGPRGRGSNLSHRTIRDCGRECRGGHCFGVSYSATLGVRRRIVQEPCNWSTPSAQTGNHTGKIKGPRYLLRGPDKAVRLLMPTAYAVIVIPNDSCNQTSPPAPLRCGEGSLCSPSVSGARGRSILSVLLTHSHLARVRTRPLVVF
jgi:hypothetical protein